MYTRACWICWVVPRQAPALSLLVYRPPLGNGISYYTIQ